MKLTNRERQLLTILAFVALNLVFLVYIVLPLIPANQQLKVDAEEMQTELNMKYLSIEATAQLQTKNNDLQKSLNELKTNFLPEMHPEGLDEYLDAMITPYATNWESMGLGIYENAKENDESSSGAALSYVKKAEVKVRINTDEVTTMEIINNFQESSEYIGIKDITVVDQSVSFTIAFYGFMGD